MDIARFSKAMIQANCRARFTAADFEFIVRTLSRSRPDAVSLSSLLSHPEDLDAVLDHELLLHALLSSPNHIHISPQCYFYILVRHVLKERGISDRRVCDYIASLLETFSRTARMKTPGIPEGNPLEYLSDMLLALQHASSAQTFLLRAHVGNYSLFLSGIFYENIQHRKERGAPDFSYYEDLGRMNYHVVANHSMARSCDLTEIYEALSDRFHDIRLALNSMADRLLTLDDNLPLLG